jgi:hypothetical protein
MMMMIMIIMIMMIIMMMMMMMMMIIIIIIIITTTIMANEICAIWKQNAAQVIPITISSTGVIPKSPHSDNHKTRTLL